MNIESISYRSIVNRYMHNDRTLIFSRIATLHLGFSDSSSLATAASKHIHNPNPLKWGFDYLLSSKCQTFLFKMSRTLARSKYSNRAVNYSNKTISQFIITCNQVLSVIINKTHILIVLLK